MGILVGPMAMASTPNMAARIPLSPPHNHKFRRSFRAPYAPQEQRRKVVVQRGVMGKGDNQGNVGNDGANPRFRNVSSKAGSGRGPYSAEDFESHRSDYQRETFDPELDQFYLDRLYRRTRGSLWVMTNNPKYNKMFNQVVVTTVLLVAAYKFGSVDVGRSYAKHWTIWQYISHLPKGNLMAYLKAVKHDPVLIKALTSCAAYGLGDFLAQFVQGRKLENVKMSRVARSALAGLLVHGPFCHYWIQFTENYLSFNGASWNIIPKVIADQTVWSLFLNSAYTTMILSLQGKSPQQVTSEIQDTWFSALSAGWKLWPLVHCVTFSPLIQPELKLLFVDVVEVAWVIILSTVVNKDRQKEQLQCVIEDFATPSEEIIMTAAMEEQVCMQDENGDMVCFVPGEGPESLEMALALRPEGEMLETIKTPEVSVAASSGEQAPSPPAGAEKAKTE
mmetsp:Transcript_10935/g.22785  ORF Transcript_10935/g.22785 Transcript_10935/m.22785 type:complete len:448 (-) Transcript_10935:487-1830(-)